MLSYKTTLLLVLLAFSSCSSKKPVVGKPVVTTLEIPELDSSLVDPKIKVFQFIEDTTKNKPYICLTRTELEKLLYDLQSIKQSRFQDKVSMSNQSSYYKEVINGLNK